MRIAIDCRMIGTTGIGTFIENVLEEMLTYKDHEFVLVGNADVLSAYRGMANCTIVDCRYKSFSLKELFCFPVKEINRCDAFFTPNFNIPLGLKIPIYCTIHDVVFFDMPEIWPCWQRRIFHWYVRRALRVSTHVFTVSEFSKQRLLNHCPSATPVTVVYDFVSKSLCDYRSKHKLIAKKKGMVYLGNIKKHKGLSVLLDAYSRLCEDYQDMPLMILGRLDCRSVDKEIINRIETIRDKITFIDHASNEELFCILHHAEVLVSPSLYEGFGMPPMEAMCLGANAIISDIPAYKEVYAGLPVTFFKAGDSDDLYHKLKEFHYQNINCYEEITNRYNYQITTQRIMDVILKSL